MVLGIEFASPKFGVCFTDDYLLYVSQLIFILTSEYTFNNEALPACEVRGCTGMNNSPLTCLSFRGIRQTSTLICLLSE